jgi:hypothetical protein
MDNEAINLAQVTKAAETIKELGLEPTVERVIEQLGEGSQSRIHTLLKLWKAGEELGEVFLIELVESDRIRAVKEGRPEYTLEQLIQLHLKFGSYCF